MKIYRVNNAYIEATDIAAAIKKSKHLNDSQKLSDMIYKLAQLASYFDRANFAHSRSILARNDETKKAELFKLGNEVLQQINKEIEQLKNQKINVPIGYYETDSDTAKLLKDAATNIIKFMDDFKFRSLGEKLLLAYREYAKYVTAIRYSKDSVKDAVYEDYWAVDDYTDDIAALKKLGIATKKIGTRRDEVKLQFTGSKEAFKKAQNMGYFYDLDINALKDCDECYDSVESVDYDLLIADEEEAIAGYEREMAKTNDENILTVLRHIVEEEKEHIAELKALKDTDTQDSVHDALNIVIPAKYKPIKHLVGQSEDILLYNDDALMEKALRELTRMYGQNYLVQEAFYGEWPEYSQISIQRK